ncbi:MAG: hypothetical protein ACQESG_04530 [Nanobdellota archaeon]
MKDEWDVPEDETDFLEDEYLDEEQLKRRLRRRKRRFEDEDYYEYDEDSDLPVHERYTREGRFKK